MSAALETMIRAMAAELVRQNVADTIGGAIHVSGCMNVHLVARAGLEAIRPMTSDMIDAAFRADPLACDVDDAATVYPPSFAAAIDAILKERP